MTIPTYTSKYGKLRTTVFDRTRTAGPTALYGSCRTSNGSLMELYGKYGIGITSTASQTSRIGQSWVAFNGSTLHIRVSTQSFLRLGCCHSLRIWQGSSRGFWHRTPASHLGARLNSPPPSPPSISIHHLGLHAGKVPVNHGQFGLASSILSVFAFRLPVPLMPHLARLPLTLCSPTCISLIPMFFSSFKCFGLHSLADTVSSLVVSQCVVG